MVRSFKLKPSTVHEAFGDETVILNLDTGSYYSVQESAHVIWKLVMDGASQSEILQRIKAGFSGDGDEIARAVAKFLDQLVEESLVDPRQGVNGAGHDVGREAGEPDKAFSAPLLNKYTDMEEMLLLDPIHEVDEHGWPTARRPSD